MVPQTVSLISIVWEKRISIGVVGLCLAFVTLAGSFLLDRSYRTHVSMFVVTEDEMSGLSGSAKQIPIAALAGFLGNPRGQSREEALAYLRSRKFTEEFIAENDLLPDLFPSRWDEEQGAWKSADDEPSLWEAYEFFNEQIRAIREDRVTGMVIISVDWKTPEGASSLANSFVSQADAGLRRIAIEEADRNLGYLRQELEKAELVQIRQALYGLLEEQFQRSMLARVADQFVFKVIDPAKIPDEDDFVFPNRPAFMVLAFLFGVIITSGIFIYRFLVSKDQDAESQDTI